MVAIQPGRSISGIPAVGLLDVSTPGILDDTGRMISSFRGSSARAFAERAISMRRATLKREAMEA